MFIPRWVDTNLNMFRSRLVDSTDFVGSIEARGMFTYDCQSVIMKKWQILEFDGKAYYAFVPENHEPFIIDETSELEKNDGSATLKEEILSNGYADDDEVLENDSSFYKETEFNDRTSINEYDDNEFESNDVQSSLTKDFEIEDKKKTLGHVYQVIVEDGVITLERVSDKFEQDEEKTLLSESMKREPFHEISDYEMGETLMEVLPNEYIKRDVMAERDEDEEIFMEEEEEEEECVEEAEMNKCQKLVTAKPSTTGQLDDSEASRDSGESRTKSRATVGPLRCKVCSETFGSEIAFRKHVAWTHKKKVCLQEGGAYICSVCDYRTLKKSLFAAHLERKHETWTRKRQNSMYFPCETCGFICRSKHSLQSHFIRKHTDKYEHDCQYCTKKFKVKGDLTNHIRFHHKEKPVNCDICGKVCQNTGSLYVHRKWAHYKPKYECHICKRRMVTQENLDQHLITQHEQREKIVCAQCGKTFTKKDSFKRHMAVHTGSKPHSCPICTKPFARQSQLRQHVLIHTGQRPFICDICGKGFTQKPGLICHRKTHPGQHPPLPVMPIADLVRDFIAQNDDSQGQLIDLE